MPRLGRNKKIRDENQERVESSFWNCSECSWKGSLAASQRRKQRLSFPKGNIFPGAIILQTLFVHVPFCGELLPCFVMTHCIYGNYRIQAAKTTLNHFPFASVEKSLLSSVVGHDRYCLSLSVWDVGDSWPWCPEVGAADGNWGWSKRKRATGSAQLPPSPHYGVFGWKVHQYTEWGLCFCCMWTSPPFFLHTRLWLQHVPNTVVVCLANSISLHC